MTYCWYAVKFHRFISHPFVSVASVICLPNNTSRSLIFPAPEGTTWLALYAIYVICDKEQGCVTNAYYRYKVVLIHSPTETNITQLSTQIFSSEIGEWRGSVVSSQPRLNPFRMTSLDVGVVVCNGMLFWVDVDKHDLMIKGFAKFDPFNDAERCHYINPPIDLLP